MGSWDMDKNMVLLSDPKTGKLLRRRYHTENVKLMNELPDMPGAIAYSKTNKKKKKKKKKEKEGVQSKPRAPRARKLSAGDDLDVDNWQNKRVKLNEDDKK